MKTSSRILMLVVFFLFMLPAWAVDLGPSNGVKFSQISYAGTPAISNTAVGWMEVDLNAVRNSTGVETGYLNVSTQTGWVVRNMPVMTESVYPYSRLSTRLDLGVPLGTAVTQLTANVSYTGSLVTSFNAAPTTVFAVAPLTMQIGGVEDSAGGPATPPTFTDILFADPTKNETIIQYDHPNEQAASNQCGPMAVANSLQYLKDTQSLQLPHEHKPGLKGDNSLVGQIDTAGDRPVTDREHGTGVATLKAKLNYLARNGLADKVSTSQWGTKGTWSGASDQSVTVNGVTATVTGKGATIKIDEVIQALREGQNCEMVYSWDGPPAGAHAVDLIGAGKYNGQPWLLHASDVIQAGQAPNGDSVGAGPAGVEFEYLGAPDASGNYKSAAGNHILQVICEKPVPQPVTETVTGVTDPAGHAPFVTAPPSTVAVAVNGTTMTVTGNASWLPLTGTISASGSFSLASTATVAGFSNVTSTFNGSVQGNNYVGTIAVGAGGQLPTGQAISWGVSIARAVMPTIPAMRMNGFRHHLEAQSSELLRPSLSMKAGSQAGQRGDWWVVATANGAIYHLDLATMSWVPGLAATYTGPLADLPFFPLPYITLPAGAYDLHFGFDSVPDGNLTYEALTYETVHLTVQ